MILAKNRLMGPTLETVRKGVSAASRGARATGTNRVASETHMEITFRLPMQKGMELMKLMQDTSRAESSPILLWAGPQGEVDIIVRDQNSASSKTPKTLLAARAECELPEKPALMPAERESMEAGELAINPGRHEVMHKGVPVPQLTYTEFGILHFLAKHAGWVFSREQIVEGVKGKDYPVTDRAVDVQVAGLRKKLGAAADHIQTVRGVGYRFKD
jgi:two-component system alkaline phosphatase synthesis response regulator PhoP